MQFPTWSSWKYIWTDHIKINTIYSTGKFTILELNLSRGWGLNSRPQAPTLLEVSGHCSNNSDKAYIHIIITFLSFYMPPCIIDICCQIVVMLLSLLKYPHERLFNIKTFFKKGNGQLRVMEHRISQLSRPRTAASLTIHLVFASLQNI